MQSEYCPRCRKITTSMVTAAPKAITGKDGKIETVVIRTYHCESCRSFVRSEEDEREIALNLER